MASPSVGSRFEALFDFSGASKDVRTRPPFFSLPPSVALYKEKTLRCLFCSYAAASRGPRLFSQDLPFKKGDIITIKGSSVDPHWWLAVDSKGKQGMVPANYLVGVWFKNNTPHAGKHGRILMPRL